MRVVRRADRGTGTGTDGGRREAGRGGGARGVPPAACYEGSVRGWAGPWPVVERWWEPGAGRRRAHLQVELDEAPALLLTLIPMDLIFLNIDPNYGQVIQGTLIVVVVMVGGFVAFLQERK